jgi:hypothetical protein
MFANTWSDDRMYLMLGTFIIPCASVASNHSEDEPM